jgi:hypothetical protein
MIAQLSRASSTQMRWSFLFSTERRDLLMQKGQSPGPFPVKHRSRVVGPLLNVNHLAAGIKRAMDANFLAFKLL